MGRKPQNSANLAAFLHIIDTSRLLEIIREDNRAILRAASAASKAADYILACRDTASTGLDVAGEDEADGFELEGRLAA